MAYADEDDVKPLLGDLELPSFLAIQTFVNRAQVEIDLALGQRYVVPVVSTDYFTEQLLLTVNADLAAAQIFFAQASGGEDNRVNAYGMFLFNRANERLRPYMSDLVLPGATLRAPEATGSALGPAAIFQQDSESLFAPFDRLMHDPSYELGTRYFGGNLDRRS